MQTSFSSSPARFRYPTCLCSSNETIRRASVSYLQDSIATAAAFGAPVVSVYPGHTLHFEGSFATLDRAGYDGCVCAELGRDCTIDLRPAARLSARRLRGWLQQESS